MAMDKVDCVTIAIEQGGVWIKRFNTDRLSFVSYDHVSKILTIQIGIDSKLEEEEV